MPRHSPGKGANFRNLPAISAPILTGNRWGGRGGQSAVQLSGGSPARTRVLCPKRPRERLQGHPVRGAWRACRLADGRAHARNW